MNERRVTRVRRDEDGELVALCNPEKQWSPVYRDTVVRHLSIGLFEYFVDEAGYISYVKIDETADGEELFTTHAPESANHLENIPETGIAHAS